jgi:RNA polymerase sigma-70 factor (ECF subfamily)
MESNEEGLRDHNTIDDNTIIQCVLKGDSNQFELLYTKYERQIFSYVYSMVNYHPQDTEDICSMIWIKAYNKLDRFNQKKKFFSWIYTIARNSCFDHLRKRRMNVVSLDDMSSFENSTIELEDTVVNRFLLQSTLAKLTLHQKNLLILRYIEGYQPKDISAILDIPVNRVSVQINRAIKQAKKLLSP